MVLKILKFAWKTISLRLYLSMITESILPMRVKGIFLEAGIGLAIRFKGKFVLKEGNEEVIQQLKEVNALVHLSEYKHKYPYDWRTKVL